MATPLEDSIQVVWHDPTSYQPLKHGPPYLPAYEPVKLSAEQRKEIRRRSKTAAGIPSLQIPANQQSPLPGLLAALQATALLHQINHWMCRGPTFFSDHKLFERLYNESLELIDQLAEKAVGQGAVLTAGGQAESIAANIGFFGTGPDMVAQSLKAEYVCLEMVHHCISSVEDLQAMPHGTTKLLEDIADKHESFTYLLQQREAGLKQASYNYDRT